ncbi:asparagine synthase-related protein [Actinomyces urogenitalis]|uniref:asparagine synthase-related protein n=1 Tax=Actinomyces urogenitalis TaxID=103621 RepID=UPI002430B5AE|nr:asparagine synthase-related protein [Actinomyces urogenitalis]MCI7456816.1 asparagine synthase-related protein [Actinomyces urogenitalis]
MKIDLALRAPQWAALTPTDCGGPCAVDPESSVHVRADYPCPAPTDPQVLRSHPGRLAAVRVTASTVELAVDRLRSWPLFWALTDFGSRLLVTDSPSELLGSLDAPALLAPARRELADAGFVSGARTLLSGVHQVPQGAVVRIDRATGQAHQEDYSFFTYTSESLDDPEVMAERFLAALDCSMTRLVEASQGLRLVIPLSGGLDSRLLVAWLALHDQIRPGRALAFTYGVPGAREVEVSRQVAQQVGLEWHTVPYERRAVLEHWHSPATGRFLDAAHQWSALPHIQDWYALSTLRDQGVVREGDVLLPGHTVVGNMHNLELLDEVPLPRSQVARAVVWYHHNLQGHPQRAWHDHWVTQGVREALTLAGYDTSERSLRSAVEGYNLRERQTKYINNSMRTYEHLGMDWALPMLDHEVWQAWSAGSARLTADRNLYRALIDRLWAEATGSATSGQDDYYEVTQVSQATRSRLKQALAATHLLGAAERSFSTWSSLHSSMAFDALITDTSRPRAALELMAGRKTLGFWTRAFLADSWSRSARLFCNLPVVEGE